MKRKLSTEIKKYFLFAKILLRNMFYVCYERSCQKIFLGSRVVRISLIRRFVSQGQSFYPCSSISYKISQNRSHLKKTTRNQNDFKILYNKGHGRIVKFFRRRRRGGFSQPRDVLALIEITTKIKYFAIVLRRISLH